MTNDSAELAMPALLPGDTVVVPVSVDHPAASSGRQVSVRYICVVRITIPDVVQLYTEGVGVSHEIWNDKGTISGENMGEITNINNKK